MFSEVLVFCGVIQPKEDEKVERVNYGKTAATENINTTTKDKKE